MHNEQQRQPAQQPDARTQQVLGRVRHIINKKNTQFILDHQHDSLAALSLYLRDCMEDIGHPPARVEVIGGDFLEYRFGSWQKALRSVYDGKAAEFLKNPRRLRTGRSCVTSARQRGCGYEGQAVLLSG